LLLSSSFIGHGGQSTVRLLVKPKTNAADSGTTSHVSGHAVAGAPKLKHLDVYLLTVAESDAAAALTALRSDSTVEYAEPDRVAEPAFVPNDPYVSTGSEWHLAKIQAPAAWDITRGATNVLIAVLDSGINAAHPDFAGRIVPGFNFVSGTTSIDDDFGHGTAVAGTVVATGNNNVGVAGVAFGCSILPVKVVNGSGFAYYSAIADGIHYAVDHGAHVINISIAGDSPSITLQEAVDYAWSNNVVVVAAAGNSANSDPQYPAACDHVVAVAATEPDDSLAPFSSYGPFVSLSAPGDNIWTTQRELSHPYGSCRGTSFASPIVAAVAALVASANPALSNDQIVSVILSAADNLGPSGFDSRFGYGRVNALQSVLIATGSGVTKPAPVGPLGTAIVRYQVIGPGRIVPDLNGKALPLGQTCHLKALPAPGQVFGGWTGLDRPCPFVDIEFMVQSNLTLVASFGPSPYRQFRGAYAGLLLNTNALTGENSGCLRFNLSDSGRFTGTVQMGADRRGFAGQFNATGDARVILGRSTGEVVLNLHLDPFNGTEQLTGTASGQQWSSDLLCFRNLFNVRSNPAPQTGPHGFGLKAADGFISTNAVTGVIRVYAGGTVCSEGRIGGVRPFGCSSIISRAGDYPFYLSRDQGNEVLIGWLSIPEGSAPPSGSVLWIRNSADGVASELQAGVR
jgi:subtilisin family serine protease